MAAALVFAALVGAVTLRLREFVFSLVTYAIAVVAATLAANWGFLGGSDGVRGIPLLDMSLPGLKLAARNDRELWPFAFALLVFTLYLMDRFRRSRLGSAAVMTHLNSRPWPSSPASTRSACGCRCSSRPRRSPRPPGGSTRTSART